MTKKQCGVYSFKFSPMDTEVVLRPKIGTEVAFHYTLRHISGEDKYPVTLDHGNLSEIETVVLATEDPAYSDLRKAIERHGRIVVTTSFNLPS